MSLKAFAIDLETTGLDPLRNSVIEFGCVYFDLARTFEPKTFKRYVLPDKMRWDIYCLKLHRDLIVEIAELAGQKNPIVCANLNEVGEQFRYWLREMCGVPTKGSSSPNKYYLEKITAAGKNFGSFDLQFLTADSYWFQDMFRHRHLDPVTLYVDPEKDTILPDLAECKKRAGLVGDVAHRALADAWDVVDLLQAKFKRDPSSVL